jgi:hypothetical protein
MYMIFLQDTWGFMSIPLLKDEPGHLHTMLDDLEFFVYVLWYPALRYRPLVMDITDIQKKNSRLSSKTGRLGPQPSVPQAAMES